MQKDVFKLSLVIVAMIVIGQTIACEGGNDSEIDSMSGGNAVSTVRNIDTLALQSHEGNWSLLQNTLSTNTKTTSNGIRYAYGKQCDDKKCSLIAESVAELIPDNLSIYVSHFIIVHENDSSVLTGVSLEVKAELVLKHSDWLKTIREFAVKMHIALRKKYSLNSVSMFVYSPYEKGCFYATVSAKFSQDLGSYIAIVGTDKAETYKINETTEMLIPFK